MRSVWPTGSVLAAGAFATTNMVQMLLLTEKAVVLYRSVVQLDCADLFVMLSREDDMGKYLAANKAPPCHQRSLTPVLPMCASARPATCTVSRFATSDRLLVPL